jgi:acyl-CoA hydrolase
MTRPIDTSRDLTLPFSTDLPLRRRFMVVDEPLAGNIRFDLLLEILDKLAEDTALEYARLFAADARVVTAAVDNILLREPADITRDLILHARINSVGRTSLEVGIRLEHAGEHPIHLASCYFTMVARVGEGEESRSLALGPLEYVDDLENARHRKAGERRQSYRDLQAAAAQPPTSEEYELMSRLHAAQDRPGFDGMLVSKLVTSNWERMYPEQENVPRKIFGGYLVRRLRARDDQRRGDRPGSAGDPPGQPDQFPPAGADGGQAALREPRGVHGLDVDLRRGIHRAGESRPGHESSVEQLRLHFRERGRRHDAAAGSERVPHDLRGGRAVSRGASPQPASRAPESFGRAGVRPRPRGGGSGQRRQLSKRPLSVIKSSGNNRRTMVREEDS